MTHPPLTRRKPRADEVLLDAAEPQGAPECLRFWESSRHFVVMGYANKVATEANPAACERLGIPILRRISGGGTVLQGPGVLNYALILRAAEHSPLATITSANQFIMQRHADALMQLLNSGLTTCEPTHPQPLPGGELTARVRSLAPLLGGVGGGFPECTVEVQGHTDLAIDGRKFSGNAQRRKRTHLLFHGAILLNLDLDLLDQVLPMPTLQPGYRGNRSHREFLMQLGVLADSVKQTLRNALSAEEPLDLDSCRPEWRGAVQQLVVEKYSRSEWNCRV